MISSARIFSVRLRCNSLMPLLTLCLLVAFVSPASANRLEVKKNSFDHAYLVYNEKPVIAFGPTPQSVLAYLPRANGNDVYDWGSRAAKFGINILRSSLSSIRVEQPAQNIYAIAKEDPHQRSARGKQQDIQHR